MLHTQHYNILPEGRVMAGPSNVEASQDTFLLCQSACFEALGLCSVELEKGAGLTTAAARPFWDPSPDRRSAYPSCSMDDVPC